MSDGQQDTPQRAPVARQAEQVVSVPSIYFNGFTLGLSSADIHAMLVLDGQPVGRLNMSFTTAKTLIALLGDLVSKLESVTAREIMTTEQVAEGLQKLTEKEG